MVGYVKAPYSFKKLAFVLDDSKKSAVLNTTNHYAVDEYAIYRSSHIRDFEWPERHGHACPISVTHLWLPL